MNLSLKVEHVAEVQGMLKELGKNSVHASRIWSNSLGEHMQTSMRKAIPDRFTMRGTAEGFRQAVILSKAKEGNTQRAETILKIGGEGFGQSRTQKLGAILARHEEASSRTSAASIRTSSGVVESGFFLPAKGLRTKTTNPPRSLYPTSIGAMLRRDGKMDGPYYAASARKARKSKGQQLLAESFYVIKDLGIFRRRHGAGPQARGKANRGEPIWWFAKGIKTPARLKLYETADEVFNRFAVAYGYEAVQIVLDRVG